MNDDLFSIVIPCKNEERFIGKALQSIRLQNIVKRSAKIIVADAGSTDNTLQVVNFFRPYLNIQVINGGLPPVARNKGARLCNSKYILFMDADMELGNSNTLQKVIDTAENNQLELVIPAIKINESNWRDKIFEYTYFLTAKSKMLGAFATGMFLFIRADAFWRLGGFNEHLPLGDDWELSHQVNPACFAIADATVYTSNRRFATQGYAHTFFQWTQIAFSKKYRDKGHLDYFNNDYAKVAPANPKKEYSKPSRYSA